MSYREYAVPERWRGLAECLWTSTAAGPYDVLPDGCMDLLWTGAELLVAGPDTAPNPYRPEGTAERTGLRFLPGVLPALLGTPATAVRDTRVPLELLAPGPARWAATLLADCAAPRLVLTRLAVALPGEVPDPGVRAAAVRLARSATAADTADALGWTTRTLHRRSLAAFGYGPAVLRRLLRFRRALALLRAGVAPADVAARAGYADQPHLSRDVRAFAGDSPARLVPSHRP